MPVLRTRLPSDTVRNVDKTSYHMTSVVTGAYTIVVVTNVTAAFLGYPLTHARRWSRCTFRLFLTALYAKRARSGAVRLMLLTLLKGMVAEGVCVLEDYIVLEASGHVQGSQDALVAMYKRMSFEEIAAFEGSADEHPVSLMVTTIASLLRWGRERF